MTVEEFIEQIGWNRVFYNKEINEYEIVFEETPRYIKEDLQTKINSIEINHKVKQIILKH